MSIRAPDITGPGGNAWRYDIPALRQAIKTTQPDGSIAAWLIKAPWANLAWHSYILMLVHLRPMGLPTRFYLEGATHEMTLAALDPSVALSLLERPAMLYPLNFAAQFIEPSDEAAIARCEKCVVDIVNGELSPDTDFTQHWIARFNASMIKGDPARAGETIIRMEGADGKMVEIVHDPVPLGRKPNISAHVHPGGAV
jgi:hypothetical protein